LRYGVDQCVGDTLCAGGIMYGQRGIAALLDFCRDIREVGAPGAILFNYANPMAMMTWACNRYGGVQTVGLCHGVQGAHGQIKWCIELWAQHHGLLGKEEKIANHEVDTLFAGINHQTWCVQARWRGRDMLPHLEEAFGLHPYYPKTEKVRLDVLKRFGFYSTESNGHLSEYLPWYRKRASEIRRWISMDSWINGETGGYLRVCLEGRDWFEKEFGAGRKIEPVHYTPEKRSAEHGSYIVEGLETGRVYRGHFNVINRGSISNLPDDCVVEVPGYVDRNGLNITLVGALPAGCAAICSQSVSVQRLAVEAAVQGDDALLRQAFLLDPLVGAVCNPPEVYQMVDEMLVAGERWLPQYRSAIAAAKRRLKKGPLLPVRTSYRGAARKAVRVATRRKGNPRAGH
jgi:alpha-galactosidase